MSPSGPPAGRSSTAAPGRASGALGRAWRWVSADEPLRGVGSTFAAELLFTVLLALSAPAVRRLPGDIYLYLFIVFWAAFRWGFPHAVFGVACTVLFEELWLQPALGNAPFGSGGERQLVIFVVVALGISAILSVIRDKERTLQRDYETQRAVALIVQRALLPIASEMRGYDVAFNYHPASRDANVGGDFLDIFALGEGRFGVLLGDVTGHGVEAAVQTAEIRYGVRALAHRGLSAVECIETINDILRTSSRDRYATAFLAVLDTATGDLTYCSAGHDAGLLCRAGTLGVEELPSTGVILGIMRSRMVHFGLASARLEHGDALVLYSDGIPEARGVSDRYGQSRLEQFIREHSQSSAADSARDLYRDVETFACGDLRDDVAVLWIRRLPVTGDTSAELTV